MATLVTKIAGAIPKELRERAQAAATLVSATSWVNHNYHAQADLVSKLVEAVERRQSVVLVYRKRSESQATERRVDPYHLHLQAGAIYVIGYCHLRKELRTFLVDRAMAVHTTGEYFERHDELIPTTVLHGTFGPWHGVPTTVRLRFAAAIAPLIGEHTVHPSQRAQLMSTGELEVELSAPISPALVAWVTSYGPQVQVLAPVALRQLVQRQHKAALRVTHGQRRSQKTTKNIRPARRVTRDGKG
ncbi:MAG: WYL domain-containing protein [Deltaproteobacteria bacterium]|nr:WYL domain-containing protein [Deltaproteobacteria bacterium]